MKSKQVIAIQKREWDEKSNGYFSNFIKIDEFQTAKEAKRFCRSKNKNKKIIYTPARIKVYRDWIIKESICTTYSTGPTAIDRYIGSFK